MKESNVCNYVAGCIAKVNGFAEAPKVKKRRTSTDLLDPSLGLPLSSAFDP